MAIIKCPECGNDISTRAKNCIKCGIPMSEIFICPECNNVMLREDNTACNKCGCPVDIPQSVENKPLSQINNINPSIQKDKDQYELEYLSICERLLKKTLSRYPITGPRACCAGGNPITDYQKLEAAKMAFNIPKNDKVFLIVSANVLGGIDEKMKGLALSSHGVYFRDDHKVNGFYYYDEFMDVQISKDGFGGYLYLSSYGFNIVSPYARDLIEMFDELKAGIRGNFNIT